MDLAELFVNQLNYRYVAKPLRIPEEIEDDTILDLEISFEAHGFNIIVGTLQSLNPSLEKAVITTLKKDYPDAAFVFVNAEQTRINLYNYAAVVEGSGTRLKKVSYDELSQKTRLFHEKIRFFDVDQDVTGRLMLKEKIDKAFESEKITKSFYKEFKNYHDQLLNFITHIPIKKEKEWYASVLLNRLMFIYFIQKKGFIDGNLNYLTEKYQQHASNDFNFYRQFLGPLFFEGFARKPEERSPEMRDLLGEIPYLNGGLFLKHELEEKYPDIAINNTIFKEIFAYFDRYIWYLDDRPLRNENEINADVLGYIFEKYINQKQMGAYYTKEDITGYISRNTIIPCIFDKLAKGMFPGKTDSPRIGQLLCFRHDLKIDDYIYASVKQQAYLPTETEREYRERHKRYQELRALNPDELTINDFITYNLDIETFARDVIVRLKDENLLKRLYFDVLKTITVLDPTCGSGAFLFAALNILFDLYEAALSIFPKFTNRKKFKYAPLFQQEIDRIGQHPNQTYFILKTIILHNLYGVDIMQEAVEICKLRLFLKMVAQIEDVNDVEPLPDIDFNILAGNTLVGVVRTEEIEQKYEGTLAGILDEGRLQRIRDLNTRIKEFRRTQTLLDDFGAQKSGFEFYHQQKLAITHLLHEINATINKDLQADYGVKDYDDFVARYQPFNWIVEFNDIIERGGFDVIIGNPPYVEYRKVKKQYVILNYKTEQCDNLYVFCMERSGELLNDSGWFGMIVPAGILGLDRTVSLRNVLFDRFSRMFCSTYAIRPSKLFDGVDQRLCIYLGKSGKDTVPVIWTTRYHHWTSEERQNLFPNLEYSNSFYHNRLKRIPQIGNVKARCVINKLEEKSKRVVAHYYSPNKQGYLLHYHRSPRYWIRAMDFEQYFKSSTRTRSVHHFRDLYFTNAEDGKIIGAILNSSLFFFWFISVGNGRNITGVDVEQFPIGDFNLATLGSLIKMFGHLMADYQANSFIRIRQDCEFQEFRPNKSKHLIDEIDKILAQHYGFTNEELDFIINYDIKYRLGKDAVT